jgi:hypothetical protein
MSCGRRTWRAICDDNRHKGTDNRHKGTGNRHKGTGNRHKGTGNRHKGTDNRCKGTDNQRTAYVAGDLRLRPAADSGEPRGDPLHRSSACSLPRRHARTRARLSSRRDLATESAVPHSRSRTHRRPGNRGACACADASAPRGSSTLLGNYHLFLSQGAGPPGAGPSAARPAINRRSAAPVRCGAARGRAGPSAVGTSAHCCCSAW